jgi:hypothetical protein
MVLDIYVSDLHVDGLHKSVALATEGGTRLHSGTP